MSETNRWTLSSRSDISIGIRCAPWASFCLIWKTLSLLLHLFLSPFSFPLFLSSPLLSHSLCQPFISWTLFPPKKKLLPVSQMPLVMHWHLLLQTFRTLIPSLESVSDQKERTAYLISTLTPNHWWETHIFPFSDEFFSGLLSESKNRLKNSRSSIDAQTISTFDSSGDQSGFYRNYQQAWENLRFAGGHSASFKPTVPRPEAESAFSQRANRAFSEGFRDTNEITLNADVAALYSRSDGSRNANNRSKNRQEFDSGQSWSKKYWGREQVLQDNNKKRRCNCLPFC